jgi:flagellar motor switch protein FliG
MELMLDEKDIQKLIEVFATREEVAIKTDLEDLRKDFARLETSVDAYAKKADAYFQEMIMLSHQVKRHEKWLHQIAEKSLPMYLCRLSLPMS